MANARRTDPYTSHKAAKQVEDSGNASTHRKKCLAIVQKSPGRTSAEIAKAGSLDRYTPSRRLPELRSAGMVVNGPARKCTITGSESMTWFYGSGTPVKKKKLTAKEKNARMQELLRKFEWVNDPIDGPICFVCRCSKEVGHTECELDGLIN